MGTPVSARFSKSRGRRSKLVIEVEFEQNGELVILHLAKGLLVTPRSVFIKSLKRGKRYKRHSDLKCDSQHS
jgi:hypothetical protein